MSDYIETLRTENNDLRDSLASARRLVLDLILYGALLVVFCILAIGFVWLRDC